MQTIHCAPCSNPEIYKLMVEVAASSGKIVLEEPGKGSSPNKWRVTGGQTADKQEIPEHQEEEGVQGHQKEEGV